MTPEAKARRALLATKECFLFLGNMANLSFPVDDYMDEPNQDAAWEALGGSIIVAAVRVDQDTSDDPEKALYKLLVGEKVIIPGCHTLPNGDPGWPDEEDLIDVASFSIDEIKKCAICAFEHTMKLLTADVIASFQEDMMFHDLVD